MPSSKDRALIGVVERAARSPYARSLVLRGDLVVRPAIAPVDRPVDAVDFLGLAPLDTESGSGALVEILGADVEDGVRYDAPTTEKRREETEAPGLRARTVAHVDDEEIEVRIDVRFGDALAVPAREIKLDGQETPINAATIEMIFAWKVHALFEDGHGQWQPQDLLDLWKIGQRDDLDTKVLPECLRTTFASRGDTFAIMDRFLGGPWGTSSGSRKKWESYVATRDDVPDDMQEVVTGIRKRVIPIVAAAVKGEPEG